MDSHLVTNILNTNFINTGPDNLTKLDQQQEIRSNENDSTAQNRRSSTNSGESDVDSGIVAIEHNSSNNSSRISCSNQLPICDLNGLNRFTDTNFELNNQLLNQSVQNNQIIQSNQLTNQQTNHHLPNSNSQPINQQSTNFIQQNQVNSFNQIDFHINQQFNPTQLNHLQFNRQLSQPCIKNKLETVQEQDSEILRNSCREVLAKLNLNKPMSNDAIYVNLNNLNPIDPVNKITTLKRANTLSKSYQRPNVNVLNSKSDSRLIANLNLPTDTSDCVQINENNQYAVPAVINCECYSCKQIKLNKLNANRMISSVSLNDQLNQDKFNQTKGHQATLAIKELLLATIRQKNLEKEELEKEEKQLQMYLQERMKMKDELDDNCNVNNLQNNNINNNVNSNIINKLTDNTCSSIFKRQPIQQTYQNVPFHQYNNQINSSTNLNDNQAKINDLTKSCFVKPTIEPKESNDDELITKSFNGGYCSKETRKILEQGFGTNNFKKTETKSFLQKFSFKFTKAFSRAFYSSTIEKDATTMANNECATKELTDTVKASSELNENEKTQNSIENDNKKSKLIKSSNFNDKLKSVEKGIDTIDNINSKTKNLNLNTKESRSSIQINNQRLDDRSYHKEQDQQFKKKNFQINLDEYCIIRKPELTPKKYTIDSMNDEKKRCTIKKRNSVNRKCISKTQVNNLTNINKQKSPHRHHKSSKHHAESSSELRKELKKPDRNDVIAELIEINKDGSQVIELRRESKRHWGFFVARGKVKNVNGVYVSRMKDEDTKGLLSGLVEIGDQILAIDDVNVKDLSILEVNHLMTNKNSLRLHVKPYCKS